MLAAVGLAAFAVVPIAGAENPPVVPFPATQLGDVFVSAQTVTSDGAISDYFAPGGTVVFRAYAVDGKTHKLLTTQSAKGTKKALRTNAVRYFYVKIPNAPSVKLHYTSKGTGTSGRYHWIGTWTVPADYATGVVNFKVLVRTWKKHIGSFIQMPVATSQLTISTTPQAPPGTGPTTSPPIGSSKVDIALYVDSVNGTRPAGTTPRPIGCTQTNVYKRGEQFVLRVWGYDLASGAILSMDNVTDAHFSFPGQPNTILNWGSHGAVGNKVWFWANALQIPKDYPLGDVTVHVSYTTVAGKVGTFDYQVTIIP
jgi:hypothetical protein